LSSILRALKKLEAEKARTQGGQIDLARDILRPAELRRQSPLRIPVLVTLLILVGGLVGMALMFWVENPAPRLPLAVESSPPVPAASVQPMETSADVPIAPPAPRASALPPVAEVVSPVAPNLPAASETPALPALPVHPRLIISGIVYQDDPESRIAVVNDLPAMTGTRIEGALVEEIRSGSVVFSYQGQHFEVFIKD
jgi:general secretion pathway protein B